MDSLQQFLDTMFGGKITVDQIFTFIVGIYALIKSITEWRAKKKLIAADKTITSTEQKVDALYQENANLKNAFTGFAEIIVTAYLSSNTIDVETKKSICGTLLAIKKVTNLSLTASTNSLLDRFEKEAHVDLKPLKTDLLDKVEDAEVILKTATDAAQEAIDKLQV